MAKYTINLSKNGQYYFNLIAGNGQVLITSETYTVKQSCKDGIASSQINSQTKDNYKRLKTSNGDQYYFTLQARNGETLGKSEMYQSISGMDNGISSCVENGNTNNIVDNT